MWGLFFRRIGTLLAINHLMGPVFAFSGGFVVEDLSGFLEARESFEVDFHSRRQGDVLALGSEIMLAKQRSFLAWMLPFWSGIEHDKASLVLSHPTLGRLEIHYPGRFLLDDRLFQERTQGFRIVESEDMPSRVDSLQGKETTPLERVFAFFVPERDLPSFLQDSSRTEIQKRFPIVVTYPEQVFLLNTNSFPAVVQLEWRSHPDHKRPYKVFMWAEESVSKSPVKQTIGETASVQLSKHGRYYWQVEDQTGLYASAPRTILIRPLMSELAGKNEGPLELKKSPRLEIKPIPVEFPLPLSLVYACPSNGDNRLPLRFHRKDQDLVEYEIEYRSGREPSKSFRINPQVGEVVTLTSIPFSREGPLAFRIKGRSAKGPLRDSSNGADSQSASEKRQEAQWTAASDSIRVQVQEACRLEKSGDYFTQIFSSQGRGGLPKTGGIVFLDGVL